MRFVFDVYRCFYSYIFCSMAIISFALLAAPVVMSRVASCWCGDLMIADIVMVFSADSSGNLCCGYFARIAEVLTM